MLDRNGRRQRRSELGDAAPPQPRALQLPESDGAVAAANDEDEDPVGDYDDDASDTEHVHSRLSTLGFD